MAFRKADGPLTVQLPSAAADRPAWLGVGAIAIVGFVLGVAWPRLVGVRPGPSVPDGTTVASAVASESARASTVAHPAALLSAPATPPAAPAAATGVTRVSVGHGVVFACKTTSGEARKGVECGGVPALDALVLPRLRRLAECPDAAGSSGALHVNVRADFARGVVSVALAREKSLPAGEALLACAKPLLASVNLDGVAHENARYSVAYTVAFAGSASNSGSANGAAASASSLTAAPALQPPAAEAVAPLAPPAGDGTAQIEWEVALVRDTPKTGKVVARLQRGTSVRVGPGKDGWYPVKFGDAFAEDGWLYRGAIGR